MSEIVIPDDPNDEEDFNVSEEALLAGKKNQNNLSGRKIEQGNKLAEDEPSAVPDIPQFQRNIFPQNLVLSASDLREFAQIISELNDKAIKLECDHTLNDDFESEDDKVTKIKIAMPVEYNFVAQNENSVRGVGLPDTADRSFPDNLKTFFISNTSYAHNYLNGKPRNSVDAFLCFEKPSLKIDLLTLPSNPTENRSVINVYGREEDWVIYASEKIKEFFKSKSTVRPIIHGSGTYDYFVYLAFLPILMLIMINSDESTVILWLESKSVFVNVVIALYALLASLLFARFIFQYVRWLFPPMEYYKNSRFWAFSHRIIFAGIFAAVFYSAANDGVRALFQWIF